MDFLAACLAKKEKRKKIRILVLDNRSVRKGTRVPFSRDWLTHLPIKIFKKYLDSDLFNILAQFGTDGFAGLPINLIETILLIHCKCHDVNFYFDRQFNFVDLDHSSIDLLFDASGGRLEQSLQILEHVKEFEVSVKNSV